MNAPLIWIVLPGFLAVILFILRQRRSLVTFFGIFIALLLVWLSIGLPIGETITLGNFTYELSDTLTILGRRFVIHSEDKFILMLIYGSLAFWFGGVFFAKTTRLFVPFGLGIAAMFTAALTVDPFLYGPLLIEMAVLASIPLLTDFGKPISKGSVRYLTFQTLGFPFILFTGWLLDGFEASPGNSDLILHANLLMALGFAFVLGVFPFHTWIPMLAGEAHSYAAAFIFFYLPMVVTLFGLSLIDRYVWLRLETEIHVIIQVVGVTMVFVGGVLAAFQRHLGRILGFAVVFEIGFSLLAIAGGITDPQILGLYFAMLVPRAVSLAVWGLALVLIAITIAKSEVYVNVSKSHLEFRSVQGVARYLPIVSIGMLTAQFSIVGIPLLAGFPVRQGVMFELAGKSTLAAGVAMLGVIGLLMSGLRSLAVIVTGSTEDEWRITESLGQRILMILGSIALLIIGLFPQWFTPFLVQMVDIYTYLGK